MEKNITNGSKKNIAIAGPTASGKSLLANRLTKLLGKKNCLVIPQDNYYNDWAHLTLKERKKINFDHINAFDFKLLIKDLKALKNGRPAFMPCYDFIKSSRMKKRVKVLPKPIIIVEGLMPFIKKELRNLFDLKLYIDVNNATCFSRRIKRDIRQRGETVEAIYKRYIRHVLPMQKRYVEPQRKFADVIINGKRNNQISLKRIIQRCGKLRK